MSKVTTEKDLLLKAHHFDPGALATIYDSFSPGLFRYAFRLLGEQDLAEECVAETFSRFLTALKNNGGPNEYLQAYLYRIAHNYITDMFRRQPCWEQDLSEQQDSGSEDVSEAVVNQINKVKIRHALSALTPDQRQVIVLKYLEGWDNHAVARSIGKPVGAVKSLQHRALAALKRVLKDELSL